MAELSPQPPVTETDFDYGVWLLKDGKGDVVGAYGTRELAVEWAAVFRVWLEDACSVLGPVPVMGYVEPPPLPDDALFTSPALEEFLNMSEAEIEAERALPEIEIVRMEKAA